MSALQSFPFDLIAERGSIREADAAELRRAVYEDGGISQEEAERLIELNADCPVQAAEWSDLFREALTDFIVNQSEPEGYVTQENADWLISRIAPDGLVRSRKELDLIVHIIDHARWSPEILVAFALAQVSHAVRTGEGPLRSHHEVATIDDDEVELVRRIIYAFGGDGNIAVTHTEAEMLCDINDSLKTDTVNSAWAELYVKAMANCLLANSGYSVPSREEALRSEAWLDEAADLSPIDIIRSITRLSLDDVIGGYRKQSREECTLTRLDREYRELVTGESLDANEADWLAARLARDGQLSPAETALIAYLKEADTEIGPRLDEIVERRLNAA
ncbi:MAG: hypothetical protein APF80_05355 [Alphaproteobacteria bacterium BRH_c36]|nr:MAG: hypothetical protein APF80_05355 [Alphaproteobacteria bacterium BRH_c36]